MNIKPYLLILAALGLLVGSATSAIADQGNLGNPAIVPPQTSFRGHTYSEWSAAWFQWVYSLPSTHHPLFDNADCSTGQTGNVWFIDGVRGGAGFPPSGRNCTVPSGTALFLPLFSSHYDNEACSAGPNPVIQKTNYTEDELRSFAQDEFDHYGFRKIIIDGVEVNGLPAVCNKDTCQSAYRVLSPVFSFTVPAQDNLLILEDGPCYSNLPEPYTVTGAVGDGIYVMIKPFPAGEHTIRFGPLDPTTGLPNRLYNITVTGPGAERQGFH